MSAHSTALRPGHVKLPGQACGMLIQGCLHHCQHNQDGFKLWRTEQEALHGDALLSGLRLCRYERSEAKSVAFGRALVQRHVALESDVANSEGRGMLVSPAEDLAGICQFLQLVRLRTLAARYRAHVYNQLAATARSADHDSRSGC